MSSEESAGKKGKVLNTTIVVAVIGLISTLITAYFGYLSNTKPTQIAINATQTAVSIALLDARTNQNFASNEAITFIPIPDDVKDSLIKGFILEGKGARVNLRFISNNLGLNFKFSAPLEMTCTSLVANLTEQLSLEKYMKVDPSKSPVSSLSADVRWAWAPTINGEVAESCSDQTLSKMAVKENDLIGLAIEWVTTRALVSP